MTVRQGRKLRDALLITGTVVMLLSALLRREPLFVIGAVIAFAALIPHFLFNKCPHCKRQLGRSEGDFCQFCGKPLD